MSIAHLDDNERMFFVAMLLNDLIAWLRAQQGTSSLRAILYMDEIFGYMPPTANPPTKRLLLTGDTISGRDAARIGLVMKSVPPELLEAEVEGLADRFALVDTALLAANKRIVNVGMELMGAQTLQRLAAENDARAHTARAARQVFKDFATKGVKQTITERDAPFGDGRARVVGPERRDADGRLLPPSD